MVQSLFTHGFKTEKISLVEHVSSEMSTYAVFDAGWAKMTAFMSLFV